MSKAVLVRGAFALQCTSPDPPVWLTVTACSHACSHYPSPLVMTGTVRTSDLAKWRQDDVCCRRATRRWNAETVTFPAMCGTAAAEQKISIHSAVSGISGVGARIDHEWTGVRSHLSGGGTSENRSIFSDCLSAVRGSNACIGTARFRAPCLERGRPFKAREAVQQHNRAQPAHAL